MKKKKRIPAYFKRRVQRDVHAPQIICDVKPPSNAARPDPARYIARLRECSDTERLDELIIVQGKLQAAQQLHCLDLVEYYSVISAWLSAIVGFEINEASTERPDLFIPPTGYGEYFINSTYDE